MDANTLTDSNFEWREKNGVRILVDIRLEKLGFVNGFSTRLGGVSPIPQNALSLSGFDQDTEENISENRRRFFETLGVSHRLACVKQVHGCEIVTISDINQAVDQETEADGLISNLSGVVLGSKTADCVPIVMGDPKTKAFAAVHAGWRGTSKAILAKTVERMVECFGIEPSNLIAAIGPAASGRSYEVGSEVIRTFLDAFTDAEHLFDPTRDGHALIDLHLANSEQLVSVGVAKENIDVAPYCTMESTDLFFSYRVDGSRYGKTGRMLAVIGRS